MPSQRIRRPISITLSLEALEQLSCIARGRGLNRSRTIEQLIKEESRRRANGLFEKVVDVAKRRPQVTAVGIAYAEGLGITEVEEILKMANLETKAKRLKAIELSNS